MIIILVSNDNYGLQQVEYPNLKEQTAKEWFEQFAEGAVEYKYFGLHNYYHNRYVCVIYYVDILSVLK